jgi:hypothetical protein
MTTPRNWPAEAKRLHRLGCDGCGECRHWGKVGFDSREKPVGTLEDLGSIPGLSTTLKVWEDYC